MIEIDRGTFEILHNGQTVAYVWRGPTVNGEHVEAWAVIQNYPYPGTNNAQVDLRFEFLGRDMHRDERDFRCYALQQGMDDYWRHEATQVANWDPGDC